MTWQNGRLDEQTSHTAVGYTTTLRITHTHLIYLKVLNMELFMFEPEMIEECIDPFDSTILKFLTIIGQFVFRAYKFLPLHHMIIAYT